MRASVNSIVSSVTSPLIPAPYVGIMKYGTSWWLWSMEQVGNFEKKFTWTYNERANPLIDREERWKSE